MIDLVSCEFGWNSQKQWRRSFASSHLSSNVPSISAVRGRSCGGTLPAIYACISSFALAFGHQILEGIRHARHPPFLVPNIVLLLQTVTILWKLFSGWQRWRSHIVRGWFFGGRGSARWCRRGRVPTAISSLFGCSVAARRWSWRRLFNFSILAAISLWRCGVFP